MLEVILAFSTGHSVQSMSANRWLLIAVLLMVTAVCSPRAGAADRVELEIVVGGGAPITSAQQWAKMLGELNIASVLVRGARPGDKTDIQVLPGERIKTYHVTGLLTSSNELQVPGQKFRLSDARRIAQWLTSLAEEGPPVEGQSEVPFGLRREEFLSLRRKLARPTEVSTVGSRPGEIVAQLNRLLGGLCQIDDNVQAKLGAAGPFADELAELSAGTAMAAVLRSQGLGMLPRRPMGNEVRCTVVELRPSTAVWPVGLSAEDRRQEILPILFDFLNVEIDNFTVNEVLESLTPRLGVPVVFDRLALEVHEIDLGAVTVSLPARRTSYSVVLQKVLSQARLRWELRVDESGKPFIWITTIKGS